jgi:hypothetical protein
VSSIGWCILSWQIPQPMIALSRGDMSNLNWALLIKGTKFVTAISFYPRINGGLIASKISYSYLDAATPDLLWRFLSQYEQLS